MKKGKVRRVIKTYSIEQQEQWDSIVRSFSEHDIYWLNGYVKAFMIHGDGTPLLIAYENGGTRGISVVMKRDVAKHPDFAGKIPEGEYTDFSTPYGYGGWLIEGEETEKLFRAYEEWLRENGIISEFVRFHPMIRNHEPCADFYEVVRLGEVVHIDLTSEEEIWSGFTAKNRNVIRITAVDMAGRRLKLIRFDAEASFAEAVSSACGQAALQRLMRGNGNVEIDMVYYPSINSWNGRDSIQYVVQDFRCSTY